MRSMRWEYLDHDGPIPFSHRGGAAGGLENTMAAFGRSVDLGFRYLETDVHVSADGALLAFHDDRLDRTTDKTGLIRDLDLDQIKSARVGGVEPIPLLRELFEAWPEARINIDPKSDAAVAPLIEAVREARALHRVCIGSFEDDRIAHCREVLGPGLCTSMGPKEIARLRAASYRLPVGRFTAACAQVPIAWRGRTLVDERFAAEAHRRGLAVHVWTIDEPDEMHRLLDLGIDGLMTDKPAVLKDVFIERGIWSSTQT